MNTAPDNVSLVADDHQAWLAFRQHSRTFSFAARLLPRPVRRPVATLYLFCRTVDTIADRRVLDIGPERARGEIMTLREQLDATLAGHPPSGFLWKRLYDLHRRFGLSGAPLYELIEGAMWDLEGRIVENETDLLSYSNLVGGSVGAMMLPLLIEGPDHADSLEKSARALGTAMQITNIVRDVGEDLRDLNRVYLPRTWLDDHGLTPYQLRGAPPPGYAVLLERMMGLAERLYEEGAKGIMELPPHVRPGIQAASRIYREILNEVRKSGYDNLLRRAVVPFWRKAGLVLMDGYYLRKARMLSPINTPAWPISFALSSNR